MVLKIRKNGEWKEVERGTIDQLSPIAMFFMFQGYKKEDIKIVFP
jgi:hypothetical protein